MNKTDYLVSLTKIRPVILACRELGDMDDGAIMCSWMYIRDEIPRLWTENFIRVDFKGYSDLFQSDNPETLPRFQELADLVAAIMLSRELDASEKGWKTEMDFFLKGGKSGRGRRYEAFCYAYQTFHISYGYGEKLLLALKALWFED